MSNFPNDDRNFTNPDLEPGPEIAKGEQGPLPHGGTPTAAERFREAHQAKTGAASGDEESSLWSGGYSSKAMLGKWLLAAVVTLVPPILIALFQLGHPWVWWGWAAVALLLWVWFALELMYRRLSIRYQLTTQRFVHEAGLLKRTTDRIEVIDIDDVTFEQGLVERMVGVGSIKIISSDRTHPQLWMRGIDNVRDVANLIDDTRRKERRLRGLHVEAV